MNKRNFLKTFSAGLVSVPFLGLIETNAKDVVASGFEPLKDIGGNSFDVVIVGGSFAGLSAAMSLGRCLRKVLVTELSTEELGHADLERVYLENMRD